jgi:aminoglycoside phosphotransferase (APT) family kinase protein
MESLSEQASLAPLAIVHGDFSTRNVIMQQSHRQLGLIDFELAGIADPHGRSGEVCI